MLDWDWAIERLYESEYSWDFIVTGTEYKDDMYIFWDDDCALAVDRMGNVLLYTKEERKC